MAIDFDQTTITYLDSHVPDNLAGAYGLEFAKMGLWFVNDEYQRTHHQPDPRAWTLIGSTQETVPQQTNDRDCGVYTCLLANSVMQNHSMTLSPTQVREARKHLALALIQGEALSW